MGFLGRLFGGRTAAPPAADRIAVHEAFGGAIRVIESPTGPAWQIAEDQRRGDGFTAMVLKFILPGEPIPLALLAKIYTIDEGRPLPESPAWTDWRAVFASMFSGTPAIATAAVKQLTMKSSLDAVEATLDGTAAQAAVPLRIRERRAVQGSEQFIVTAMGTAEAFAAHGAEIEQWFSTAAFVPMADPKLDGSAR